MVENTPFYVGCKRPNRGPAMKATCEQIRMVTEGLLANDLQGCMLDDISDRGPSPPQIFKEKHGPTTQLEQIMFGVFCPDVMTDKGAAVPRRSSFLSSVSIAKATNDIGQ